MKYELPMQIIGKPRTTLDALLEKAIRFWDENYMDLPADQTMKALKVIRILSDLKRAEKEEME